MAGTGDTIIFQPGTLITMPNPTGGRAYFYLEGPVSSVPTGGLLAQLGGIVLIVYPSSGGAFTYFLSWPPQVLNGTSQASEMHLKRLPCGLTLHVTQPSPGTMRFCLELENGTLIRELVPLPGDHLKIQVHPVHFASAAPAPSHH